MKIGGENMKEYDVRISFENAGSRLFSDFLVEAVGFSDAVGKAFELLAKSPDADLAKYASQITVRN